jgi:hypothetical protein
MDTVSCSGIWTSCHKVFVAFSYTLYIYWKKSIHQVSEELIIDMVTCISDL